MASQDFLNVEELNTFDDNIRDMFTDGEMIGQRDSKYDDRCHAANVQ